MDGLNTAWQAATGATTPLVAFSVNDDGMLIWLNDRSPLAYAFATGYLITHSGTGNDINGNPRPYDRSGLTTILPGAAAAAFMRVPANDSRVPDIVGIAQYGVVYTGGKGKMAEHGGDNPEDRDVPIVVSGAATAAASHLLRLNPIPVETTQIAPTILKLLGLSPGQLQAVQLEHTAVLPGI
jgi:hypothetical protein